VPHGVWARAGPSSPASAAAASSAPSATVLEARQLRELLAAATGCLKPERGERLLQEYRSAGVPVTDLTLSWLLEVCNGG
jgi:hypothetical protein